MYSDLKFDSFFNISNSEIAPLYSEIIKKEQQLSGRDSWDDGIKNANDIANATKRIMEHATQSIITRSYNSDYGLSNDLITFESDAAHVNLMCTVLDFALAFKYRDFPAGIIPYYREIMNAARRHDLPENLFGDSADNNSRDEKAKRATDRIYQTTYDDLEVSYEHIFDTRVSKLVNGMDNLQTPHERLLKCADKAVAVLMTLCLKFHGFPATILRHSRAVSKLNRQQMRICRRNARQYVFEASELWTVDYLVLRRFDLLDSTGFITAVLIMATLMVNKEWYPWREKKYDL